MKKDMPLEGLRWSRDSGSALYDTPQTAVLGRAGGVKMIMTLHDFDPFMTGFLDRNEKDRSPRIG